MSWKVVLLHFLVWVWAEEEIPKYHQKNYSHSISNLRQDQKILLVLQKPYESPTNDPVS